MKTLLDFIAGEELKTNAHYDFEQSEDVLTIWKKKMPDFICKAIKQGNTFFIEHSNKKQEQLFLSKKEYEKLRKLIIEQFIDDIKKGLCFSIDGNQINKHNVKNK